MHLALQEVKGVSEPQQCLTLTSNVSSIGLQIWRTSMKKKETLNFRVPAEFKRRLIEEANKQRRSLTNYLETTLMEVWEKRGSEPDKPPEKKRQRSLS